LEYYGILAKSFDGDINDRSSSSRGSDGKDKDSSTTSDSNGEVKIDNKYADRATMMAAI
jgi:hypothetical protein